MIGGAGLAGKQAHLECGSSEHLLAAQRYCTSMPAKPRLCASSLIAADYIGGSASPVQTSAYKGAPPPVMGMGATSGVTSISIIFGGVGENTGGCFFGDILQRMHGARQPCSCKRYCRQRASDRCVAPPL